MTDLLEVWSNGPPIVVTLDGDTATLGRAPDNTVVLDDDTVSWLHAKLTRYGTGWTVRDLGSSNGTLLNGDRVVTEQRLRNNDEISTGSVRIRFRTTSAPNGATADAHATPKVTPRERDVLRALCGSPTPGAFARPASVAEIATGMGVTEPAVRIHLNRLYKKFGIAGSSDVRMAELASAAIRSRVL